MNINHINSSPMKRYELLSLLICLSMQLFAQDHPNRLLKGVLYDYNSRQPLMYANIFVKNSNTGVMCSRGIVFCFVYAKSIPFNSKSCPMRNNAHPTSQRLSQRKNRKKRNTYKSENRVEFKHFISF